MLTESQKMLLRASVPVLKEKAEELTTHFYNKLLGENPHLKNLFNLGNQMNGMQQKSLAMALVAFAEHIDNPGRLAGFISAVCNKHVSVSIDTCDYALVGFNLIRSVGEVLKLGPEDKMIDAWTAAYEMLASIMIKEENEIMANSLSGGESWLGWRKFSVVNKVVEADDQVSLYLSPADGCRVASYKPGQYISIRMFIPALKGFQIRQYSLSDAYAPGHYRITCKRVRGKDCPDGIFSNFIHDHMTKGDVLDVSAPMGDFYARSGDKNIYLISGGIGQTPLLPILKSTAKDTGISSIHWIHGDNDLSSHAFRNEVNDIVDLTPRLKQYIFYRDIFGLKGLFYEGDVDLNILPDIYLPNSAYYICGQRAFIDKHIFTLRDNGVRKEDIFYEEFSPVRFFQDNW